MNQPHLVEHSAHFHADLSLEAMVDYMVATHHRYIKEQAPLIKEKLQRVVMVHGAAHPELAEIEALFAGAAADLLQHLRKEEMILFPYIVALSRAEAAGERLSPPPFGQVANPINMMLHEHDGELNRFERLAQLTGQYTPPEGACNTYRLSYNLLAQFAQDLHTHIGLENEVLFPKAVEVEALIVA